MATRYDLKGSGSAAVSPPFGSLWFSTGSAVRLPWTTSRGTSTQTANGAAETSTTNAIDVATHQWVCDTTFTEAGVCNPGSIEALILCLESSSSMNAYLQVVIRIVASDNTTERGVLYAGQSFTSASATAGDNNGEFSTTFERVRHFTGTCTPVIVQPGDRPVIEMGYRACNTSATSFTGTLKPGSTSGTDLTVAQVDGTSTNRPWIEFGNDPFVVLKDPRDIASNDAWYSAEYEASFYSDGDEITTLHDISGNSNHLTGATTGTLKPRWYATGGPSGGPRIRFDNGGYFISANPHALTGATSGEIMATIKGDYNASGTDQGFHHFGSDSGSSNHYGYIGTIYDDFGSTSRKSVTPSGLSLSSWRRLTEWSAPSNDWAMYLDGVLQTSSGTHTVGWKTQFTIGNSGPTPSNTTTDTFEGDYGVIVLSSAKYSTSNRDSMATWVTAHPSGGGGSDPIEGDVTLARLQVGGAFSTEALVSGGTSLARLQVGGAFSTEAVISGAETLARLVVGGAFLTESGYLLTGDIGLRRLEVGGGLLSESLITGGLTLARLVTGGAFEQLDEITGAVGLQRLVVGGALLQRQVKLGTASQLGLYIGAGTATLVPNLELVILDDTLLQAPGSLNVTVNGALPSLENGNIFATVQFYIDGVLVYEALADAEGNLGPTSVPVPVAQGAAGSHTLEARATSRDPDSAPFTITLAPATAPGSQGADAEPVEVPEALIDGKYHWVLQDLMTGGLGSWVMIPSPTSVTPMRVRKTYDVKHTTASSGRYHLWEAPRPPMDFSFAGYCPDEDFYNELLSYCRLNRRFWLIDHRNRAWKVALTQPDLKLRRRQRNEDGTDNDWAHDYVVKGVVYDQDWVVPQ